MGTVHLIKFSRDIRRSRDLVGLGQAIGSLTAGVVDASDLYRSSIVQAVAAWDRYVHGVVLDRSVRIVLGDLAPGSTTRIGLPLHAVAEMSASRDPATREIIARSYVAERLSRETFQGPEDVATAMAMVGVRKLWSTAFPDADHVKRTLSLIVARRNNIVHACDFDPLTEIPTPLTDVEAVEAITDIEGTVRQIDGIVE